MNPADDSGVEEDANALGDDVRELGDFLDRVGIELGEFHLQSQLLLSRNKTMECTMLMCGIRFELAHRTCKWIVRMFEIFGP